MNINPFAVFSTIQFLTIILCGISVDNAYAYLDPGTGSYVIQVVIAAFLGGLFAIKMFWTKIKTFFKNLFSKSTES